MKVNKIVQFWYLLITVILMNLLQFCTLKSVETGKNGQLFDLGANVQSRSISFENPTGEPGKGGQEASKLGVGRKGFPAKNIEPGETAVLCDIAGSGTINHIWMTGGFKDNTEALRSMVVRAYWENQEHPSIECPLGDFMGNAHAKINSYQSAVHSTGINAALNIWLPMPFMEHAKMTLTNEGKKAVRLFYQIDYTINEKHPEDLGRLHVCFRRENPTTLKNDFEMLPQRKGKGRFIGAVLGIRALEGNWWGEGEIKIYMDGDTKFPTICGTGSEDYVCLSYGMQQTPFMYHGCSWNQKGFISMYRWHIPDPIFWHDECRITIQQIGWSQKHREETGEPLYERQDDWTSATFWYEAVPSAPLPEFPDLEARVSNLWDSQAE